MARMTRSILPCLKRGGIYEFLGSYQQHFDARARCHPLTDLLSCCLKRVEFLQQETTPMLSLKVIGKLFRVAKQPSFYIHTIGFIADSYSENIIWTLIVYPVTISTHFIQKYLYRIGRYPFLIHRYLPPRSLEYSSDVSP